MGVQLVALDTESLIPLADMLDYLRVTCEEDEAFVEELLLAACELVEAESETNFINKSYREVISTFPTPRIYVDERRVIESETVRINSNLDYPLKLTEAPLVSVTSITYYDANGEAQAFTDYTVDVVNNFIQPSLNNRWPQTQYRTDAVTVLYVAGKNSVIPRMAKQAVRLLVSHWYNHLDAVSEKMLKEVPLGFKILCGKINDGGYI